MEAGKRERETAGCTRCHCLQRVSLYRFLSLSLSLASPRSALRAPPFFLLFLFHVCWTFLPFFLSFFLSCFFPPPSFFSLFLFLPSRSCPPSRGLRRCRSYFSFSLPLFFFSPPPSFFRLLQFLPIGAARASSRFSRSVKEKKRKEEREKVE